MKQPQPNPTTSPQAYPAMPQTAPAMPQTTPAQTAPMAPAPVQAPQPAQMPPMPTPPMPAQAQTAAIPTQNGAGASAIPEPVQQPEVNPMPQAPVHEGMTAAASPEMLMPDESREGGEKALPRISIHAFCDRSETASTVQASTHDWRMARTNMKIYMGGLPAAIEYYRNESTPAVIIFESSLRGPELFSQLEQLASVCDAETKVVMIGAVNDIRLYRDLMEQGLSEYLVPPFHPLTLIRSLGDLFADPDKPFIGRVISFFGAKGGVGSSTMAHNIAWALASNMGQETALVDMDSSWGTTGLDFAYDSTKGIEEALSDPDRLDETLLDRIMLRHTEKLSILPAAATLGSPQPTSLQAYEKLVEGVRSLSPVTVLDLPHIWSDWSSEILKASDETVITASPDLANLRNAKNLIEYLKAARPNDPEPLLILNKTGVPKTEEIPLKEFAAAVGVQPAVVIGYEPVAFTTAANQGKMLSEVKGAAPAFEGLMYLAHRLKTGQFPIQTPAKKAKKGKKVKAAKAGKPEKAKKKSGGFLSKMKKRK